MVAQNYGQHSRRTIWMLENKQKEERKTQNWFKKFCACVKLTIDIACLVELRKEKNNPFVLSFFHFFFPVGVESNLRSNHESTFEVFFSPFHSQ